MQRHAGRRAEPFGVAGSSVTPYDDPVGVPGSSVSRQPTRPTAMPSATAGAKRSPVRSR